MTSTPSLPHRFREDQFRRYEPTIAKIVAGFPGPVQITPASGLSPITFENRLRDAMASLATNKWPSIVDEKFHLYYPSIVVANNNGILLAGDRAHLKMMSAIRTEVSRQQPEAKHLVVQEIKHLDFILELANVGILTPPLTIIWHGPPIDCKEFSFSNILVNVEDNKIYII
jgi:hypothetical protein